MRSPVLRLAVPLLVALAAGLAFTALTSHRPLQAAGESDFAHFESGHVHPLAMTPDGARLLAVNTPDNRLAVFDVTGGAPVRIAEIPVGLEPVSVCARTNGEAWVVNHLSDDVSVVDLATMNVKATVRVGDEPSDVVFANGKAWVSVSQENALKLYDPANLATAPTVVSIPGRKPRALAVKFDGSGVFVAIFNANHATTILSSDEAGDSLPPPNPPLRAGLPPAPEVGLIVRRNASGEWRDESGKLWSSKVPYNLTSNEFVEVNTTTRAIVRNWSDIGVILMGAAYNPVNGLAAVSGTDARNQVRFEPNLAGIIAETRVAFCKQDGTRLRPNVNPHINYAVTPGPQSERDSALGIPTGIAFSPDGQRLYMTSLATNKLGVFVGDGTSGPRARVTTIAGPTGVVCDPVRPRIYVLGRFRNQLQTLSTATLASASVVPLGFDPTPDAIVNGRKFFYGGSTSGHGDQSCASCHVFGDTDHLGWDLGNPQGDMQPPPPGQIDPFLVPFHPMKGPMTTQSLRGLPGTGLLHWRGDRADLAAFNPAFVGLMGRSTPLPDSEMTAFSSFVLPLVYPPNPNQRLDRSMPDAPAGQPSAARGRSFFLNTPVDGGLKCNDCHTVPSGTNGQLTDATALQSPQDMKIPQLRNMYQKTGFTDAPGALNIRGFGFTHDGSIDNLFNFLKFPGFNFGSPQSVADANRRDMEAFMLAFDTGMAPAVGRQITWTGANGGDETLIARMDTIVGQANAGNCDLIAKGRSGGVARGWKYVGGGSWISDVASEPNLSSAALLALAAPGSEITVLGVPFGSGTRIGIDRDRDGYRDRDETVAGTDPGDPASHPVSSAVEPVPSAKLGLRSVGPNPFRTNTDVLFTLPTRSRVSLEVLDLLGRRVRTVVSGVWVEGGSQRLTWDGRRDDGAQAAGGAYFLRLSAKGETWTRMVVRVR